MKLTPTSIHGAFLIEFEGACDSRGSFGRVFCAREFREHGLNWHVKQANICHNRMKGTLRGMHYQVAPFAESKLVRCIAGAIFDVIVDLRPESPSFLKHVAEELTDGNRRALYVPPLCAHGYQTLTDDTDVFYQTGEFYAPDHERGLRHDDPVLKLKWPLPVQTISDKDSTWPLLSHPARPELEAHDTRRR